MLDGEIVNEKGESLDEDNKRSLKSLLESWSLGYLFNTCISKHI